MDSASLEEQIAAVQRDLAACRQVAHRQELALRVLPLADAMVAAVERLVHDDDGLARLLDAARAYRAARAR